MLFNSNLLATLGRAIGLSAPTPGDTDITIPPLLQGVITPIPPLDSTAISGSADVQTTAFNTSTFLTVTNGGAAANNMATLSKGLWRFYVDGTYSSNYGPLAGFADMNLSIVYGTGTVYLMSFQAGGAAAAPTVQSKVRQIDILIPVDGAILRWNYNANGAGQTQTGTFTIVCQRLL